MLLVPTFSPLVSNMQVVSGGQSLWMYTLLFTFLQIWGRLLASTSSPPLPAPELSIYLRSGDSVVLVCQAPKGHRGVLFMLYRHVNKVDSQQLLSGAQKVNFTVSLIEENSGRPDLYCCVYKNQENRYSAFSPYLQLQLQKDAAPTSSAPSLPAPFLSVQPRTVKKGDVITFSCLIAAPLPQYQYSSRGNNEPMTFLLLRAAERTGVTSISSEPPARQSSNPASLPGVFSVGPLRGEDEGEYSCVYQISTGRGRVNSTASNKIRITITDMLPAPTLLLQQQTDVWHLQCTGLASYPGAVFSLYLADSKSEQPVATQRSAAIHHQVMFPLPVQDTPMALYQCQYSFLLRDEWSISERSLPLAVAKGTSYLTTPDKPGVDWPLVLGSLSAIVLFLCSVVVIAVVVHRKAKAAAKEKKERQDAKFWTQVHGKDHVVDISLRSPSFTSQDWGNSDTSAGTSRFNSLSTFTTPIHHFH